MSSVGTFISDFVKRGGILVMLSTFLGKFMITFLSIAVIRFVTVGEYADIAYILSFFSILVVFSGIGGNYSLLRFGAITRSIRKRKAYYHYTLQNGVKYATVLAITSTSVFWLFSKDNYLICLFAIMSFALVSYYMLDVMRSYFRIIDINKMFAKINVYFSVIAFALTVCLTWFFNTYGYLVALGFSPIIVFFIFSKYIGSSENKGVDVDKKEFWSYGIHTSVSAIANQIIFSIAPLLVAYLSEDKEQIALFKVATIIPFNVLTLPGILMQTDFTALARNSNSSKYLLGYYFNYLKIIGPLSIVGFFMSIYFGEEIIVFIFGKDYRSIVLMYQVFMIAAFFSYLLRNPIGNILLAIGKAKWNGYNTYFFCILYVGLSFFLYPIYNVYSIVYSLAFVFVFSGVVSLGMFIYYLKSLKKQ
jgi:O-antigen/teichoic acid export membrane protein